MINKISRGILRLFGWKTLAIMPPEKSYIVVVAPHTSNWDFVWGQLFYLSIGMKAKVLIKKELFYFPIGNLLRSMGGVPVDRRKGSDVVDEMIREFSVRDSFILVLTPEGTRSRVDEWKTGFHRIARGAVVPIVLGFIDYEKKQLGTAGFFYPGQDPEADMKRIKSFYAGITPRYPEKFSTGND
jgi:1-acyl-sn-glycerol-3-phosphate acyltransferase